jgi:hypothetical protein
MLIICIYSCNVYMHGMARRAHCSIFPSLSWRARRRATVGCLNAATGSTWEGWAVQGHVHVRHRPATRPQPPSTHGFARAVCPTGGRHKQRPKMALRRLHLARPGPGRPSAIINGVRCKQSKRVPAAGRRAAWPGALDNAGRRRKGIPPS